MRREKDSLTMLKIFKNGGSIENLKGRPLERLSFW